MVGGNLGGERVITTESLILVPYKLTNIQLTHSLGKCINLVTVHI